MVFHRRCGTLAFSLSPRGAQPRSGAILVLVQVATDRSDGDSAATAHAGARHRGGPVRWRSASFFVTELLRVHERPHHTVVHLQALGACQGSCRSVSVMSD